MVSLSTESRRDGITSDRPINLELRFRCKANEELRSHVGFLTSPLPPPLSSNIFQIYILSHCNSAYRINITVGPLLALVAEVSFSFSPSLPKPVAANSFGDLKAGFVDCVLFSCFCSNIAPEVRLAELVDRSPGCFCPCLGV